MQNAWKVIYVFVTFRTYYSFLTVFRKDIILAFNKSIETVKCSALTDKWTPYESI